MATSAASANSKVVQVSDDGGTTWHSLPGASGEISREAQEIDDSILGQEYQSQQVGLIGWQVTGSAIFKGFAGYLATLKVSGTAVTLTDAATTQVGSTQKWTITVPAGHVLDPGTDVVVEDGGSVVAAADIEAIDRLFPSVTFRTGYTVTGAITVSGRSMPVSDAVGRGMTFTLNMTADTVENTDFQTAQGNDGYRTYQLGLKTVGLDITGIYDATADYAQFLQDRDRKVVEINPGGAATGVTGADGSVARGFFYLVNQGQSGDVGALEEESLTFSLSVPSSDYAPFCWQHSAGSTLPRGAQICLDAFVSGDEIDVRYLHDGSNGWEGNAVVSEATLEGGLDVMNEFRVTLMGTGAHMDVTVTR